jgi:tRNA pseudouridine55 synthase
VFKNSTNPMNLINSMNSKKLVINLNKPRDISSHKAATKVKQLFSGKKAGHAGTLDPIATGVLIVCLNEATKITRFLSDLNKEYIVRLKLGERTDTYDLTGRIIEKTRCPLLNETDIRDVLSKFKGQIKQLPPMYSAIKVNGKRLYKLARIGLNIERPERTINIYKIDLVYFNLPFLDLKISCSKGTYIRTLCDDIGKALGVGAHMVSLERTRVGIFCIGDSASMEELQAKKEAWHSIDSAISHLSEMTLDEDAYRKARNGMPIITPTGASMTPSSANDNENNLPLSPFSKGGAGGFEGLYINQYIRLKNPENILFGIGKLEKNMIRIERLLDGASGFKSRQ